jgi:hypothetical protein
LLLQMVKLKIKSPTIYNVKVWEDALEKGGYGQWERWKRMKKTRALILLPIMKIPFWVTNWHITSQTCHVRCHMYKLNVLS